MKTARKYEPHVVELGPVRPVPVLRIRWFSGLAAEFRFAKYCGRDGYLAGLIRSREKFTITGAID